MDLLLQRAQHEKLFFGKTAFKLHAKVEFDEEERHLLRKYGFENAILLPIVQPELLRNAIIIAVLSFFFVTPIFGGIISMILGTGLYVSIGVAVILSGAAAFFYYTQKRETILTRDLIHGRYFRCISVVELAKKEAWLANALSVLRQVMETAKHWDGVERIEVLPLPSDQAKFAVIKAL